jgi:hypothetical protein
MQICTYVSVGRYSATWAMTPTYACRLKGDKGKEKDEEQKQLELLIWRKLLIKQKC